IGSLRPACKGSRSSREAVEKQAQGSGVPHRHRLLLRLLLGGDRGARSAPTLCRQITRGPEPVRGPGLQGFVLLRNRSGSRRGAAGARLPEASPKSWGLEQEKRLAEISRLPGESILPSMIPESESADAFN